MTKTAVVWIRDGTLVEKMHIVLAATAIAARKYMKKDYPLEYLINKFLEYSGLNAEEKMKRFDSEHGGNVFKSINAAVESYNEYVTRDYKSVDLFDGVEDLLKKLQKARVQQFLISGYSSKQIKEWLKTKIGKKVGKYLEAYLTGEIIQKGASQFKYIRDIYDITKFYFVADAVSEMSIVNKNEKKELGMTIVGFANYISPDLISKAVEKITRGEMSVDIKELRKLLPNQIEIKKALKRAGADRIVKNMTELKEYFKGEGILK